MTTWPTAKRTGDKRLVIVGGALEPKQLPDNEDLAEPIARFIDASDYVIRMNDIKNHQSSWIGQKTNMLAVSNTGNPGNRYSTEDLIRFNHIDPPTEIFWAYTPYELFFARQIAQNDPFHGHDFADAIVEHQGWSELKQHRLSKLGELQLNAWLHQLSGRKCLASTGIRAIWFVMQSSRFARYRKYLVGFGFEGWSGHAFDAENQIVDALASRGKLQALEESDLT